MWGSFSPLATHRSVSTKLTLSHLAVLALLSDYYYYYYYWEGNQRYCWGSTQSTTTTTTTTMLLHVVTQTYANLIEFSI